jgi:hypothetical protein
MKDFQEAMEGLKEAEKELSETTFIGLDNEIKMLHTRISLIGEEEGARRVAIRLAEMEAQAIQDKINLSPEAKLAAEARIQEVVALELELESLTEANDRLDSAISDLGSSFQTAFEDAIIGGKKFSDILAALEEDIIRIGLRATFTDPLKESFETFLKTGSLTNEPLETTNKAIAEKSTGLFGGLFGGGEDPNKGTMDEVLPSRTTGLFEDVAGLFGFGGGEDEGGRVASEAAEGVKTAAEILKEGIGTTTGAVAELGGTVVESAGAMAGELAPAIVETATETATEGATTALLTTSMQTAATAALSLATALQAAAAAAATSSAVGAGAAVAHKGGVVGRGLPMGRFSISSADMAGAQVLHEGGIAGRRLRPNEQLGVLEKGETVRTEDQESMLQSRMRSKGGIVGVTNNFFISGVTDSTGFAETGDAIGANVGREMTLINSRNN